MNNWSISILAEPVISAWTEEADFNTNGAQLQRAILRGFSDDDPNWISENQCTFVKTFHFKEHGEFFRGLMMSASLRYAGDFYERLKQYGTLKVTIVKSKNEAEK